MNTERENKEERAPKRIRFVFEADAAYGPVVDALCRRYLTNTSGLLRRLVVDDARRNGIEIEAPEPSTELEAA